LLEQHLYGLLRFFSPKPLHRVIRIEIQVAFDFFSPAAVLSFLACAHLDLPSPLLTATPTGVAAKGMGCGQHAIDKNHIIDFRKPRLQRRGFCISGSK
jgi:hypothetical protein